MEEEKAIKILENIRGCLSLSDWKERGLEVINRYIKDLQITKNKKIIWILQNIKVLLKNEALFETKEYIKIELENLKGLTEKNCRNRYIGFYDYYCNECKNLNCNNNKNITI